MTLTALDRALDAELEATLAALDRTLDAEMIALSALERAKQVLVAMIIPHNDGAARSALQRHCFGGRRREAQLARR